MGSGLPGALARVDVADVSADGNARYAHEWLSHFELSFKKCQKVS
jgi:hypothetical protein